jgi:hypothetical protein
MVVVTKDRLYLSHCSELPCPSYNREILVLELMPKWHGGAVHLHLQRFHPAWKVRLATHIILVFPFSVVAVIMMIILANTLVLPMAAFRAFLVKQDYLKLPWNQPISIRGETVTVGRS